ncbi:hypothetical protein [Brevundimonas poindexterae]|nr:hypothetical protein [Brevundimonas poindexterae]
MCQPSDPSDLPASAPPRRHEGVLIGLLAGLILLQAVVLLTTLTG